MDLTSLGFLILTVLGILGLDTAINPTSVILEATVPSKLENATLDQATVAAVLEGEVNRISSTPSVMSAPEIRVGSSKGIAMAIAESLKLQTLVVSLQTQLGLAPEQLKLSLMTEGGVNKAVISGNGQGGRLKTPPFENVLTQRKTESILDLVHRASVAGLSQIDPYFTALHLMQKQSIGQDFLDVEQMIDGAMRMLPSTPTDFDRSLFENLRGLVALFKTQPEEALRWFNKAVRSGPDGPTQALNAAFAEVQLDRYRDAADRMEWLVTKRPPADKVLLGTAYMTWGAALAGLKDRVGANDKLAEAVRINPDSSLAHALWADIKEAQGQKEEASALHLKALEASGSFENYAEIATLYFQLAWRDGQPLTRSAFGNPGAVRLLE